ncbi:MAG: hypothetical protein ACSHXK_03080 [Oceanococcus sp.]
MIVTHSTLEKALQRIFREQNMEAYSSIPFRELQGFWSYTGLRQSDLRDAVRGMFEQNLVDFQNDGGGLAVVLTPSGAEHLEDTEFHLTSAVRDTLDKVSLHKAKKRIADGAHAARQSAQARSEDRSAAP